MMSRASLPVLAAALLLLFQAAFGAVLTAKQLGIGETDNAVESKARTPARRETPPTWVKMNRPPPKVVKHTLGTVLELECEAFGTPAPTIQWLRNNEPIAQFELYDSDALLELSAETLAKVNAKLVIDNFIPTERTSYTCVAEAGGKFASATTEVITVQGLIPRTDNLSGFIALDRDIMESPSAPRVVQHLVSVFEYEGSTIVLPCKVTGNPLPEVYWFDNEHNPILHGNPRIKVLDSGDLLISHVAWSDMGGFTCVAKNLVSKDSAMTFLYPMSRS